MNVYGIRFLLTSAIERRLVPGKMFVPWILDSTKYRGFQASNLSPSYGYLVVVVVFVMLLYIHGSVS